MNELYIGLMSGTSIDGIDAALVDLSKPTPKLIASHYEKIPISLKQAIQALCHPGPDEINRMGEMDVLLGKQFATAVNTLLKKHNLNAKHIRAIGSHGQTIRHHPARHFTLQIGDPNVIAARTGITTVADFRRKDLALGGQGAPLVPAFHQAVFLKKNKNRIVLNMGGIANVTLFANGKILGFDTGPGNMLLDLWTEKHLQKPHDDQGTWAKQGVVHTKLLTKMLADTFFKMPAPKSTGREYFNAAWLDNFLIEKISAADVQATLTELTAKSIAAAIQSYVPRGEIFVCGGGAHNNFLMSRLQHSLPTFSVQTTTQLGIDPDWVEAMAFAWLAKQTLKKKSGNIPEVTGAKTAAILGGIYQ